MKNRRILSIILLILGASFYLVGNHIADEVAHGQKKIEHAQQGVDQARGLSSMSPYTQDLGDVATGTVQKKIDAGREEAGYYQMVANWLHGSGAVLFIIGAGLLVFSFVNKRKH
jgi:hypothetical protein